MNAKKIITLCSFISSLFLVSCFNMDEDINITNSGSGTYTVNMDMSGMFQMIQMMKMMDTTASSSNSLLGMGNIDSTIFMKNYLDTVTNITPQERELFTNATIHIIENDDNQILKVKMDMPFKSITDYQKLMTMMTANGGMANMMGKIKGMGSDDMMGMGTDENAPPDIQSIYIIATGDNFLEKKVDEKKLADLKANPQWEQMQMSAGMMGSYTTTTTIHLPRPAKTATGDKVKLSDDKKTITISASFSDLFDKPESLAYMVEF